MKKKISVWLLTAVLLVSCLPFSVLAEEALSGFERNQVYSGFSDVESGAWYEPFVQNAVEFGMIDGVGKGRYDPNGTVTVAQAIKIAACVHAVYQTGKADFSAGTPWYQPYVDYAKKQGMVSTVFSDYNAPATRLQIAEIFVAALPAEALPAKNTVVDNAIPDVATGTTGAEQVYQLYRAGISQGSDDQHSYLPETCVRRAEISAMVTRLILPELRLSFSMPQAYTLGVPTITGVTSDRFLSLTVNWKKVAKADGYSFCLSNQRNGEYKFLSSVSDPEATSRTFSVEEEGTYYLKMAAYRTVEGKTVFGSYTEPYTIIVSMPGKTAYAAARQQAKDYLGTLSQRWNWGSLQYSYYDMDGNGVPEMFVRCKNYPNSILAIYTYVGGHAVCLYICDFEVKPGRYEYFTWECYLLESGVVFFCQDNKYYNYHNNLVREVLGADFNRLSEDKSKLVLIESLVAESLPNSDRYWVSTTVSSRNYMFTGSKSGLRSTNESGALNLLDKGKTNYGYGVQIADWNWKDF